MNTGFFHRPGWTGGGFGFGPRRHGRRFKRGILKFVLLKLISEQSRHGYDLMQVFKRKGWAGGAGSIYPLLAALEEEGFIAGRDEGERRTYEITEKGRRHLGEHSEGFGAFFDHDEDAAPEASPRNDLRDAAGRLMQAVAQVGPCSTQETVERVREALDRTRKEIYTLLAGE